MNPQANDIDFNDPKVQKVFAFFQQQQQQQQMQQMLFQQQQQQLMMQQQFMMQQQNQQLWNEFLQYCKTTGQNSNDVNLFNQYCQIKMMMNMNNMNNMNNNMNNMNNNNMNNMMNNMNNMNNNILQQSLNNSTNQNQQSTYIKSEEQTPRDDTVYLKDKETIPRVKKTVYVNENELQGNSGNNFSGFSMNQKQNSFMKMSSSTDIINVTLTATSGLKVVIPAQKSMSLSQLFKIYVKKVGVPEAVIGTKIVFLFNAEKLDHNSQQPITNFFKAFNANITVLDQANIIGA